MDLEDQYGMADLRQLMNERSNFPTIPQHPELFSGHRNLTSGQPYDMLMMGRHEIITSGLHDFGSDSAATSNNPCLNSGLEAETVGNCLGGDGGTGRWPRQETLTLLEIRSRLDSKFKEANQKGPIWDEVSRIMSEEHGYQRSGKKCREKFENLYKYYKKTKEGKAGRQDGKHYRFFLQLEALYGETSNNQISIPPESYFVGNNNLQFHTTNNTTTTTPLTKGNYQEVYNQLSQKQHCDSLSLSQCSSDQFDSSSNSDDNDLSTASGLILDNNESSEKKKKRRSGYKSSSHWKLKIKEFIDSHMKKLMDRQEGWLAKVMKTLEQKERERSLKEEEWRRLETSRIDREVKFWAKERAWMKERDSAFVDALQKLSGNEIKLTSLSEGVDKTWSKSEISKLIELRANLESDFSDEVILWEDIAAKMVSFGYDRSPLMYKEKWESINSTYTLGKPSDLLFSKKRKDNCSTTSCSNISQYFQINNDQSSYYSYDINNEQVGSAGIGRLQSSDVSSSSDHNHNHNVTTNAVHDACFPFLMGTEGDPNLWHNYGALKLNKGGQN